MVTEQFQLTVKANGTDYDCAITEMYDESSIYYVIGIGEPVDNQVTTANKVHAYIMKMRLNCETGHPQVYDYNVREVPVYVKEIEQYIADTLCKRNLEKSRMGDSGTNG